MFHVQMVKQTSNKNYLKQSTEEPHHVNYVLGARGMTDDAIGCFPSV